MAINVLINGVGGPTPRSIARSLHRYSNMEYTIIGTDINPRAHGLYEKDLYHETYVIPPAGNPAYWSAINNIIEKHDIEIAIVQPELEVLEWTKYKKEGGIWPCKVFLPDHAIVENLIDKALMTNILKKIGLVPASITIDPLNIDYSAIEQQLPYPFWIRSTSGSSGLGSLKVKDKASLKNWITINPKVNEFIASTFLSGRNLACKLLFHKGKLLRAACGERVNYIMSKVAPSGITGNTSFGRLLNEPKLIDASLKALELISIHTGQELHGFFTADFKEDQNGTPFITEINVRMVAFNMSFAAGGANFSEDIIRILTEDPTFDYSYKMYEFEKDLIFLRDVDAEPKLMKETELLKPYNLNTFSMR
ncbi:hypothetical protein [Galbibacter sp. PAP.153]|uniref:hypothetical protein n=1 Tax=Galbibacter sp. PAP.153 TaxID=3104623 RepID=UPI00300BD1DA